MENKFHNAVNPENIPKPVQASRPRKTIGKQVLVDNSVVFTYDTSDTENYDNIRTLEDVLSLHAAKPNVLIGIHPQLYSAFMDTTGGIVPYVKVGDKVKYKNPRQADVTGNPVRTISNVYFKSIGDMSVIVAEFEEGDYALTNLLIKTNGN